MAQVRCADGRVLDVVPVPVLDRTREPYEVTLRLLLDGVPFGDVGERCAGALCALAARLDADPLLAGAEGRDLRARAAPGAWPLAPRDLELFSLRCRDPDDVRSAGELRAVVQRPRSFQAGTGWRARTEVVLQAWGDDGTGVRAVLDVEAFRAWLDRLLDACPTT